MVKRVHADEWVEPRQHTEGEDADAHTRTGQSGGPDGGIEYGLNVGFFNVDDGELDDYFDTIEDAVEDIAERMLKLNILSLTIEFPETERAELHRMMYG